MTEGCQTASNSASGYRCVHFGELDETGGLMNEATSYLATCRVIGWLTVAATLGLAVTGTWLAFFHTPNAVDAWNDIEALQRQTEWGIRIRNLHQILAVITPVLLALWFAFVVATRFGRGSVLIIGGLAAALIGVVSGLIVPWRHVALKSFTVGTNLTGFNSNPDQDTTYVLIDGSEVRASSIRLWMIAHLAACAVAIVLQVLAIVSKRRTVAG